MSICGDISPPKKSLHVLRLPQGSMPMAEPRNVDGKGVTTNVLRQMIHRENIHNRFHADKKSS